MAAAPKGAACVGVWFVLPKGEEAAKGCPKGLVVCAGSCPKGVACPNAVCVGCAVFAKGFVVCPKVVCVFVVANGEGCVCVWLGWNGFLFANGFCGAKAWLGWAWNGVCFWKAFWFVWKGLLFCAWNGALVVLEGEKCAGEAKVEGVCPKEGYADEEGNMRETREYETRDYETRATSPLDQSVRPNDATEPRKTEPKS